MSRFFSEKYLDLEPYVPGEQPKDQQNIVKLNTNENPYPPMPEVTEAVAAASSKLYLYSDTECVELRKALAKRLDVSADELLMTNGSDEILNFAFMAFCDNHIPAVFADITYGFYPVFAAINRVPYEVIPLKEDLTIDITDYYHKAGTIFIANPNAPTAIALRAGFRRGKLCAADPEIRQPAGNPDLLQIPVHGRRTPGHGHRQPGPDPGPEYGEVFH